MTRTRASTWLCLADSREARLLQGAEAPEGNHHFEVKDTMREAWEELEHRRPSARTGKGGHTYASEGHEHEERRRRHGRDIASWLERALERESITRVAVVAPAHVLSVLRRALPSRLAESVDFREGDLVHLATSQLPSHPLVSGLLDAERPDDAAQD